MSTQFRAPFVYANGCSGIVTVCIAAIAFRFLYDYPETAEFLSDEERAFVVYRLKYQGQRENSGGPQIAQAEEFKWKYVVDAFLDWQVWVNIFVYWGVSHPPPRPPALLTSYSCQNHQVVCPLYGISLFLPTIIRQLGYQSSVAQLMTVPIYFTAAILSVTAAHFSDRVGKRSPFILGFLVMMAVGFAMCIATDPKEHPKVVYGGVFVAACAIYPAFPGVIAWLSNNLAGSLKRSVGMALQIGVGNLGGVRSPNTSSRRHDESMLTRSWRLQAMASNFYRQRDAPRYRLGHALELGFIGAGFIASLILVVGYRAQNRKRAQKIEEGELDTYTLADLSAKGDRAVTFRYVY